MPVDKPSTALLTATSVQPSLEPKRVRQRRYSANWFERRPYEIPSPNNAGDDQPPTPERWDPHCRATQLTRVFRDKI